MSGQRIIVVAAGLLAVLLGSVSGASPATADGGRLTLRPPVEVSDTHVKLSGRAPAARRSVVVQRRVGGRWVKVTGVQVRAGTYATRVRARSRPQRMRVVSGGLRSAVRVVPPAEAAAPVPTDACGPRPTKVDGSRWSCTFADDFSGSTLDRTKWRPQVHFATGEATGSYACYRDHPENINVSGGALHLTVRKHAEPLPCNMGLLAPSRYTAGMVSTYHLFSQRYGRFEARFKSQGATVPGLQEAFWLWPDDRQLLSVLWPAAGEIDIVETYSQYPDLAIPFLHYTEDDNGGPVPGLNTAWNCRVRRDVFNTYTLEWSAGRLEILVNGKSCLVNTSRDEAFQRKYIVALTQALGSGTNGYVGTAPLPATMSVDYVRVWR